MKRVEIKLAEGERTVLERVSTQGVRSVREVTRAQILLALDRGLLDQMISEVLGIERTRIWRIRQRYLESGVEGTLTDRPRCGRPVAVDEQIEASIVATACSEPPEGRSRWTLSLLAMVVSEQYELLQMSAKTVGRALKKNGVSLG
ncbi:MAG: helix-turn-helix domain-containing protein [Stenomitos frigidus ULC029]